MGRAIRRKNPAKHLNAVRKKTENKFQLPIMSRGAPKPRPLQMDFSGLKPNTKYKVGIPQQEANKFEDITDFCQPRLASKKYNTHKSGKKGRWYYFKTDDEGRLFLFVRNNATERVNYEPAGPNWTDHWKYVRPWAPVTGRNNIILIEYSKVIDPTGFDKIKTIRSDISTTDPIQNPPKSYVDVLIPEPTTDKKYTTMSKRPDYIQSFYVDNKSVGNSKTVDITDVTLYLRKRAPRLEVVVLRILAF